MYKCINFILLISVFYADLAWSITKHIEITDAVARPSMSANGNSAVYLKIKNGSHLDLLLTEASNEEIADSIELHQSIVDKATGVAKMIPVDQIAIPKSGEVALVPGGMHIMLMGLKRSLKIGDKFDLELLFRDVGTNDFYIKPLTVEVKKF